MRTTLSKVMEGEFGDHTGPVWNALKEIREATKLVNEMIIPNGLRLVYFREEGEELFDGNMYEAFSVNLERAMEELTEAYKEFQKLEADAYKLKKLSAKWECTIVRDTEGSLVSIPPKE